MDSIKMTPAVMAAWKLRWRGINSLHQAEVRAKSASCKADELSDLLEFAESMGWIEKLRAGEDEVRRRWMKWREAHARAR